MFITDSGDVDFSRSFLLALDRNTSHNHTLPFDLYPGQYRVYVYDIEQDGTLHNGVGCPAVTERLFISLINCLLCTCAAYHDMNSPQIFNCTLNIVSHLIWAECSHSNTAGIQVIVRSTNVSEVHKLYVNQSMDLDTPVTVSVERDGEYQVSIIAIRVGILRSGVGYTQQVMVHTSAIVPTSAGQPNHIPTLPSMNTTIPKCKFGVLFAFRLCIAHYPQL